MLYDHPISLLHLKNPHDIFIAVLVITGVPSRGDQPYSAGLQKHMAQQFIALARDSQGLEKNLNVSICKNSR